MSNDLIKCPKCGSTQLTTTKKGFSGKKAVVGGLLTGGIGILAGTIGSNKIKINCIACGNSWMPQDYQKLTAVEERKKELEGKTLMERKRAAEQQAKAELELAELKKTDNLKSKFRNSFKNGDMENSRNIYLQLKPSDNGSLITDEMLSNYNDELIQEKNNNTILAIVFWVVIIAVVVLLFRNCN